jgi:hypothetical protein
MGGELEICAKQMREKQKEMEEYYSDIGANYTAQLIKVKVCFSFCIRSRCDTLNLDCRDGKSRFREVCQSLGQVCCLIIITYQVLTGL